MKKIALFVLLAVAFCQLSFSQNEKCLSFSHDMIKQIKGEILSEFVCPADKSIYVIKAEVLPDCTIDVIKAASNDVPKTVKVISDWTINYDKNYEKNFGINGKNILVTFYPNDKVIYFEFPVK